MALCYLLSDRTSHEESAENAEPTQFGMREVRSPSGVHRGGDELGGRHAESFDLLPIGTTIGGDVAGGARGRAERTVPSGRWGRDQDGAGPMDGGKCASRRWTWG